MKRSFTSFFLLSVFVYTVLGAGSVDPTFNASVTEGYGYVSRTLTQTDGKILAFGSFQRANGARFNNIVRFNADGTLDAAFSVGSGANGSIEEAVLQTDGKIIIGGNFTSFNGVAINRLARLNPDGSLDPTFNPAVNFTNYIEEIAIQPDGKILVAAALAGSPAASRIFRLASDGSLDPGFQNNLEVSGGVNSIVLAADSKILVGGSFSTIAGSAKPGLARLNADGTVDNAFTASIAASISKIIIEPDGKLLLAGSFPFGAYRLNADGSEIETGSKSVAPFQIVYHGYDAARLPDGKVLVAYGVGSGEPTNFYVLRLNADLTLDESFQPTAPDYLPVTDITLLADGKFIISGNFVTVNDQTRLHIARLNANGSPDPTFGAAVSTTGTVRAIKRQPDGKILIGGIFEMVNGVRRTNIARLNADGSLDNTFNVPPGLFSFSPSYVYDIDLQSNGKILVARYIFPGLSPALNEQFGSISDGGVLRLNSDGSLDESFATIPTGLMISLKVDPDNNILIGGWFDNTMVPPFGTGSFARLLPNGGLDTAFLPQEQPLGSVYDIAIQPDDKILISGLFANVGGIPRNGIVRYNADGTLDESYFSILQNVHALGLTGDGKIYAGGNFPLGGGNVNTNLARLNADGSIDSTFVGLVNAPVRDLIVQTDGKVIVGGDFTRVYSNDAGRIARINPNGSFDPTFDTGTGASGSIYALEDQTDGKILAGGQFLDFDGAEKLSLVRLLNTDSSANARAPFDFDGDGKTDVSVFRPAGGEWWYERSSDSSIPAFQFGSATDRIVPADYTGDGRTDIAVWRASTGEWFILRSEDNSYYAFPFGSADDIPVPADFDGDGRADAAVFRPSSGTWYISQSTGGMRIEPFGVSGDIPVPADFDGDALADIAIFRPSTGDWWINRSSAGLTAFTFGTAGDRPVQGDYTGDGKADAAFWRASTGEWFVLRSENASYYAAQFGTAGDVPAAGDYDGDGRIDTAVFRPENAVWYIDRSTSGLLIRQFGLSTDRPVPSAFNP
jgi:uncharacterized delta-60 repeat protein